MVLQCAAGGKFWESCAMSRIFCTASTSRHTSQSWQKNMFNFCVFNEANLSSGTLLIRPRHPVGEIVTESGRWPYSHTVGLRETVTEHSLKKTALGQVFLSSAAQLSCADIPLFCSWHVPVYPRRPVWRHVAFHSHLQRESLSTSGRKAHPLNLPAKNY